MLQSASFTVGSAQKASAKATQGVAGLESADHRVKALQASGNFHFPLFLVKSPSFNSY